MKRLSRDTLTIGQRISLFFAYVAMAYAVYGLLTGVWQPTGGGEDLWILSVVALSAVRLVETPFFRKPSDSLLTAVMALFALWALGLPAMTPLREPLAQLRYLGLAYAASVVLLAAASIYMVKDSSESARRRTVLYRLSTRAAPPELLLSLPVVLSLAGFHHEEPAALLWLSILWLILCLGRPLEGLVRIAGLMRQETTPPPEQTVVGMITRIDSPDVLRVDVVQVHEWTKEKVHLARLPDGSLAYVLPLFVQVNSNGALGTGLARAAPDHKGNVPRGSVVLHSDCPDRAALVNDIAGVEAEAACPLAGFVVEDSTVGTIIVEVAADQDLEEGRVVFCGVTRREGSGPVHHKIYYQIVGAKTTEESFDRNPRGTLRISATQLGIPDAGRSFRWYPWVPPMNAPVFLADPTLGNAARPELLKIGTVPGTAMPVELDFGRALELHTAVLGSTGMGKTELVFDIIRDGITRGGKIICIDFTGEYVARLADLTPQTLGLPAKETAKLAELVDDVETGAYSAADEKRALTGFLKGVHPAIATQVGDFLANPAPGIAIFELEDIANSRATLRATEIYLSEVFKWARANRRARSILVVLEEAHTIIPEANLFGFDRSDTQAVVGRMAQIALQGRKYGVGLLLVSQRTALVSKTVLSQCSTHLCFALVDRTSLEYMTNVFGPDHLQAIPNLQQYQFVAYGSAIRCDRPIIVQRDYDPAKKAASDALGKTAPPSGSAPIAEKEHVFIEDDDLPF